MAFWCRSVLIEFLDRRESGARVVGCRLNEENAGVRRVHPECSRDSACGLRGSNYQVQGVGHAEVVRQLAGQVNRHIHRELPALGHVRP